MRYLTVGTHPNHDTLPAFRRTTWKLSPPRLWMVLELAQELQLLSLGTVSLDGTHIKASASKDKNATCQRAQELRAQLRQDINERLQQAERADQQGQDLARLPKEIARREKLLWKMDEVCARLEQRARARAAAERADYERKVAARQQREGSAKGPEPKPPTAPTAPDEQINLTDQRTVSTACQRGENR